MVFEWKNPVLKTVDPDSPIFQQKEHTDQLLICWETDPQVYDNAGGRVTDNEGENVTTEIGKNLKEIDFDEHSIVHRAVAYMYASDWIASDYNKILERVILDPFLNTPVFQEMGRWLIDEELFDSPTATQIEEAEEVRLVSKLKDPSQSKGPIATSLNSSFVTLNYINFVRAVIEWLRNYRTCQTMHTLLGKEREKFLCPICEEYDIYPQELYCYKAYQLYEENLGEWYKNDDDEWDVFTWTNPYLHPPLVMDLDRDHNKDASKIYFRDNQSLWNFVNGIVPEGETKEDQAGELRKWNIPKDSYLFFDNHYRRYKVNLNRSIIEFVDGNYGEDVLGDVDNPNFWMEISPSLKFDVKKDSEITLSQFKVKTKASKEATIVEVDLSNMFFFDMDDWFETSEAPSKPFMHNVITSWDRKLYFRMLITLNKFLSPQTKIKFQGHDRIYTIKKADRNLTGMNPFSANIELTEKLERDVVEGEAVFLYTYIEDKHIEEIRTALDNLEMPPIFEYRTWVGPYGEEPTYNTVDIENCESTVTYGTPTGWVYVTQQPTYERQQRTRPYNFDHHCTDLEALRAYSNLGDAGTPETFAERHQCLIDEGKKGSQVHYQHRNRNRVYEEDPWDPWIYEETGSNPIEFQRLQATMDGERYAYPQLEKPEGWSFAEFGWYNGFYNWIWKLHVVSQIPLKGTIVKTTIYRSE